MAIEKRIYAASLEDVFVPVSFVLNPVDPTADVVYMAFIPTDQVEPEPADWNAAAWDTSGAGLLEQFYVRCLVGPGGTVELDPGQYQVFVKITDSPEVPVKQAATLLRVA